MVNSISGYDSNISLGKRYEGLCVDGRYIQSERRVQSNKSDNQFLPRDLMFRTDRRTITKSLQFYSATLLQTIQLVFQKT